MDSMMNAMGFERANSNGLTDEQIAERPETFVGMVGYFQGFWGVLKQNLEGQFFSFPHAPIYMDLEGYTYEEIDDVLLLAGEPNCPWPPPKKFQHEWKEGDRAWVRTNVGWEKPVAFPSSGIFMFPPTKYANADNAPSGTMSIDTPAIYIPETEVRNVR